MALSKTTATAMIQPTAACPAGGKGNAKTNPCRTLRIATATANRTVRERRSCFRVGMGLGAWVEVGAEEVGEVGHISNLHELADAWIA